MYKVFIKNRGDKLQKGLGYRANNVDKGDK